LVREFQGDRRTNAARGACDKGNLGGGFFHFLTYLIKESLRFELILLSSCFLMLLTVL